MFLQGYATEHLQVEQNYGIAVVREALEQRGQEIGYEGLHLRGIFFQEHVDPSQSGHFGGHVHVHQVVRERFGEGRYLKGQMGVLHQFEQVVVGLLSHLSYLHLSVGDASHDGPQYVGMEGEEAVPSQMNEFGQPGDGGESVEAFFGVALQHQGGGHGPELYRGGLFDLSQKFGEGGVGRLSYFAVGVAQHVEEPVQKVREVVDHVNVGDAVQHGDPSHQELADVRVGPANVVLQQGHEYFHVEGVAFRDDVFDEPVQEVGSVFDIVVHVGEEFAESVEYLVEVGEDVGPGHFGDVVERLAGVVSDPALGIVEAVQDGRQEDVQIIFGASHESDGGGGDSDESPLAVVGVHASAKVSTEDGDDGLYEFFVFGGLVLIVVVGVGVGVVVGVVWVGGVGGGFVGVGIGR
mmetsp:Transcript_8832/g.19448  ORF Transcript_8832/g.19448 Transcript_8832/m.19448 type:complete len:407 (-) Transcript_8832:872-2092(-)